RIARNLLAQELRSRRVAKRRGQEVSLDDIQRPVELRDRASTHGALTQLLAAEQLTKLRSEVIRLPPQMRRCFVLRNAQGLRYREIASVLDISIEAVKVQLYRARSRLRQITATDGELS
ncbi:MAG: sigma factor-like helix-turn-helix DNA-binding protein, partial [Acidobacteriota bacterium]